jgi:phenylalanyl-tRNA synthetase alpha chain
MSAQPGTRQPDRGADQPPEQPPLDARLLRALAARANDELAARPATADSIAEWEREHLGRRSAFSRCRARLGRLPEPERAALGREWHRLDRGLREAAALRLRAAQPAPARQRDTGPAVAARWPPIDPTVPPPDPSTGGLHPVTMMLEEAVRHFADLGFSPFDAPEVEDVAHSFDLLGVPADHPTRAASRTFYTTGDGVLRSHTTASVLRVLADRAGGGPIRFTVAGACHRNTVPSPRLVTQFHQLEAVAVGPRVRVSDLKGMALGFVAQALGQDSDPRLRFRALPYVSPGIAVDVRCRPCGAAGCDLCRGSGRLEIMGGGMLTRAVLGASGVPEPTRAAALAISLERVLAVRHGLGDIRHFLGNDHRVLAQFR